MREDDAPADARHVGPEDSLQKLAEGAGGASRLLHRGVGQLAVADEPTVTSNVKASSLDLEAEDRVVSDDHEVDLRPQLPLVGRESYRVQRNPVGLGFVPELPVDQMLSIRVIARKFTGRIVAISRRGFLRNTRRQGRQASRRAGPDRGVHSSPHTMSRAGAHRRDRPRG